MNQAFKISSIYKISYIKVQRTQSTLNTEKKFPTHVNAHSHRKHHHPPQTGPASHHHITLFSIDHPFDLRVSGVDVANKYLPTIDLATALPCASARN